MYNANSINTTNLFPDKPRLIHQLLLNSNADLVFITETHTTSEDNPWSWASSQGAIFTHHNKKKQGCGFLLPCKTTQQSRNFQSGLAGSSLLRFLHHMALLSLQQTFMLWLKHPKRKWFFTRLLSSRCTRCTCPPWGLELCSSRRRTGHRHAHWKLRSSLTQRDLSAGGFFWLLATGGCAHLHPPCKELHSPPWPPVRSRVLTVHAPHTTTRAGCESIRPQPHPAAYVHPRTHSSWVPILAVEHHIDRWRRHLRVGITSPPLFSPPRGRPLNVLGTHQSTGHCPLQTAGSPKVPKVPSRRGVNTHPLSLFSSFTHNTSISSY